LSPKNTEKVYGKKANQPDPVAGQSEEINTDVPDDPDNLVIENTYPSAD
jgi:hypothetical protein